jgi:Flp pilus assembly protein TadB
MDSGKIIALFILIIVITAIIIAIINTRKNSKKINELRNKELRKKEHFKINNPEKYEQLAQIEQKKKDSDSSKKRMFSKARNGVIIFAIAQLFLEIIMNVSTQQNNIGIPVAVNAFITIFILRSQIFKKNKVFVNPLLQGLIISIVVFVIRVILGLIFEFITS